MDDQSSCVAKDSFDARADAPRETCAKASSRRLRRQIKKERRLVFDLIRFVVDVIAMASG